MWAMGWEYRLRRLASQRALGGLYIENCLWSVCTTITPSNFLCGEHPFVHTAHTDPRLSVPERSDILRCLRIGLEHEAGAY